MATVIHRADSRGYADHGWLKSFHTFSFARYYEPTRVHFGRLRVLNDDVIAGGTGFGQHPHDNMEIVSIPLKGAIEHRDTTGTHSVITSGEVQIMSAGSGLQHSEFNASKTDAANFLQIWVMPKEKDITPRYGQKKFELADRTNAWQTVVAPDNDQALWINQDSWFNLTHLMAGQDLTYNLHGNGFGAYLFVISGEVTANGEQLGPRDAAGFSEVDSVSITAVENAELLLIEVPMQ